MKAFERMEKREQHQRKKEALQEQAKKPKEKEKESSKSVKMERDSSKSDVVPSSLSQKAAKQHSVVCLHSDSGCTVANVILWPLL